jgi:LacI family transcriptional regulator
MLSSPAPDRSKTTIADIARDSGVSPATVSLVLRDKPGISPETRQRVLDSAQALGYISTPPKPVPQGTVSSIGLILKVRPDDEPLTNQFYAPVLAGIEAYCRRQQTNLFYAHMPVDEDNNPLELPRLLQEQPANGLLILGAWLNDSVTRLLQPQETPLVLVDAYAATDLYDAVITDNETGAYQATLYLIENGHQHIAIVGSLPRSYPSIQERRNGYVRAMTERHLEPRFVDCHLYPDAAVPATIVYLEKHPEVTAIFSCNDEVAIGVMGAVHSLGKRVPQDVSIIGFDNIALAQHVTPALTTMRVDKRGMGRLAAQLLFNRLEYPEAGQVCAVIRPSLIERQSVRRLEDRDNT